MQTEELRAEALRCYRRAERLIVNATARAEFAQKMSEAAINEEEFVVINDTHISKELFLVYGYETLNKAQDEFGHANRLRKKGDRLLKSFHRQAAKYGYARAA